MNAKTKMANCAVLPSEADGTEGFVRKLTPFLTKKAEVESDPQYQDGAIDKSREQSTSRKRSTKEARPL